MLRVIARLNMGGPAHHVTLLSGLLDPSRYETLLLHGRIGSGEESLEELVRERNVKTGTVPGLAPELRPASDLRALVTLARAMRRFRPDIVHTHTAKAGMLGRLAAVLTLRPRPVIVHTYHGHVLEGYFGRAKNLLYRGLERALARRTDALIGVSQATVDDLVRLRIAASSKFRVIPIGLDLEPFLDIGQADGARVRDEAGAASEEILITFVGRLVPIKRVDVAIRALARARELGAPVRLAVVGDGDLRPSLEALARELGIAEHVAFLGYRSDMPSVAAAGDIALLTSDNEGTPVSLIEAAAAGNPAVATAVGGVADVVIPGTGLLVPPGDHEALGSALARLALDADERAKMGATARRHVLGRFTYERLLTDIDELYEELLGARRGAPRAVTALRQNACA